MAAGLALEDRAAQTCLYQPVLQAERRYNMEAGQKWRQYMAAGAANLGILAVGLTMGWTSPTIPKLNNNATSPLDDLITPDQESWLGSLITVGAAIGPLYSGVGADMFGRRLMILSSGIPLIIGWVLAATAKGVGQLYAARIVWGLATGQLFTCVPMYVGEIAEDDVRGALGSFLQMFITVGFLLAYAIGPFVSYLALTIVSVVPVIIFMVIFFFMPDSPAYLIKKGRKQQATIALQKLRGKSEQGVMQELNDLQSSQDVSDAGKKAQFSDLWTNRGNFKSLYLACGLVSLQQLSGINVVLFYMETIFDKAGSGMDPAISTIIIGVVQVLASSVTPFVVDRLGRKLLLNISSIGMTFALLLLGLFFILDNYDSPAVEYLSWLPIAALVLFMCVYCIGFGPLPWAVIGELLDPSIKSLVSTIATTVCWVVGFIITKFFGSIGDAIGMHFAFWIFAVFTFLAFFFVQFLLPETKGRSLQEIQDLLNGRKISKTEKS